MPAGATVRRHVGDRLCAGATSADRSRDRGDRGRGHPMTRPPRVPAQLEMPPLPAGHRLGPIVRTALARDGHVTPPAASPTPWPARYFGLDRVLVYQRAPASTRRRVLAACAADVLAEAFFIEKLGIGFAAKMVLLSETAD